MNRAHCNILKDFFKKASLFCCATLLFASCVKEPFERLYPEAQEGETWLTLDFGAELMPVVSTRASAQSENQLFNFYLFIFNNSEGENKGKKVYGRMFDEKMMCSGEEFSSRTDECWFIKYAYTAGDGVSYPGGGKIRVKAPLGADYNIYVIGNLDADMIRISSELLSHNIDTEEDLKNFEISMNQDVVSRNGYFPMSGSLRNVKIEKDGDVGKLSMNNGSLPVLHLLRFDAKIEFTFKPDRNKIRSFEAKQWRVINVPKTSYVLSYAERRGGDDDTVSGYDSGNVPPETPPDSYGEYAADFFDTPYTNFEDVSADGSYGFTFYMLPSRMTPKNAVADWEERSRQVKLPNGRNKMVDVTYAGSGNRAGLSRQMRVFENANDFSTYILVTGRVDMELENEDAGQILGADVQYLIHLGDWSAKGSVSNYNIRRNKNYKYTVTVNSVDNIRVEVETSKDGQEFKENQPGASGEVTVAKEEIAICDAHYTTKTLTFHLSNFYNEKTGVNIADELTWTAQTPFSRDEGMGAGGGDVPTFPDYKWVHFRLNKMNADGTYSENMRKYTPREFATSSTWRSASDNKEGDGTDGLPGFHNDGIMDIIYLVQYIKDQVRLYQDGAKDASAFDKSSGDPLIRMTVFVDEYYYEENPWTHERDPYLWKEFVNARDRSINILCDSNVSKDGESKVTGSVITIQQHAIQSIYTNDVSPDLRTAWGLELSDEYAGQLVWIDNSGSGNVFNDNGLLNSALLWDLCYKGTDGKYVFRSGTDAHKWSDYIEFEVKNSDVPLIKGDAASKDMRYSCFTRNRDNNGDGVIDRDEIRWYMASVQQLIGIFVGDAVLSKNVRLYNRSAADMASADKEKWMQHVISSTQSSGTGPLLIWAEEGISTSPAGQDQEGAGTSHSLRCVRNLGQLDPDAGPESYELEKVPQGFGEFVPSSESGTGNGYFDAKYLNPAALRYYTSRELEAHNNNSLENRLYRSFEVCNDKSGSGGSDTYDFIKLNEKVTSSVLSGQGNPFCPEGYRLPNQRELAVLKYFGNVDIGNQMSRTHWIFGALGEQKKMDSKNGFSYNGGVMTVSDGATVKDGEFRCVRDIDVR